MADPYKKPYWDSDVFIGWIKGERIPETRPDGSTVIIERGLIAEHLLTLAEQGVFPIVISGLSFAEVHKHKGKPKLTDDENDNVLDYFEAGRRGVVNYIITLIRPLSAASWTRHTAKPRGRA